MVRARYSHLPKAFAFERLAIFVIQRLQVGGSVYGRMNNDVLIGLQFLASYQPALTVGRAFFLPAATTTKMYATIRQRRMQRGKDGQTSF